MPFGSRLQRGCETEYFFKLREHFRPNFEGVQSYARSDGGGQGRVSGHFFHGGGNYSGDDSPPPGVNGRHGLSIPRGDQDGNAVGDANGNRPARVLTDQGIGFLSNIKRLGFLHAGDLISVNLMHAKPLARGQPDAWSNRA